MVEAFKYDDGSVGAGFGVRLSLTAVIGIPNGLLADKVRDDQLRQDKKFDFSGSKDQQTFETFAQKVPAECGRAYSVHVLLGGVPNK